MDIPKQIDTGVHEVHDKIDSVISECYLKVDDLRDSSFSIASTLSLFGEFPLVAYPVSVQYVQHLSVVLKMMITILLATGFRHWESAGD